MWEGDGFKTFKIQKAKKRHSFCSQACEDTVERVSKSKTPVISKVGMSAVARCLIFEIVGKRKPEEENSKKKKSKPFLMRKKEITLKDEDTNGIVIFDVFPNEAFIESQTLEQSCLGSDEDCQTDDSLILASKKYLISQVKQALVSETIIFNER